MMMMMMMRDGGALTMNSVVINHKPIRPRTNNTLAWRLRVGRISNTIFKLKLKKKCKYSELVQCCTMLSSITLLMCSRERIGLL